MHNILLNYIRECQKLVNYAHIMFYYLISYRIQDKNFDYDCHYTYREAVYTDEYSLTHKNMRVVAATSTSHFS